MPKALPVNSLLGECDVAQLLRRDLIEEYQPDLFEVGQGTAYRITAGDHCPFNNAVRLG